MRSVFQEKTLAREYQFEPNDYEIKPFYTVMLNSLNYATSAGTGANTRGYNFDWSIIPDVPYEVHFTYIGELNNIDYATLPLVYIDLNVATQVYEPKQSKGGAPTSQYLGFLETYLVGASSFLHAEDGTNCPIYLAGRPCNNQFTVRILNNDGNPFTASGATALGEYVLTLNLYPRVNVKNSMI
jgi:hypothetical protein